jgi:PAS domain S-box-containing protein
MNDNSFAEKDSVSLVEMVLPPSSSPFSAQKTEVRRKEALQKMGALQHAIFNSANFSSIATDEKGVIQLFNVGAERMLGYTAADVVNKITPADISDSQELIARALALSAELATTIAPGFEALVFKASRGIEDIYELTYIRKDGSRFPAVVSVTALRDDRDDIIGYLLIGTDNTARKRAEEALLKAGALQSAIFNSANFSSIATDEKGVIQLFNVGAERMLGYTAGEVLNTITPADISDPQEVIARAVALSAELATTITPGFEALVFKASRGIEDIYELTYIRKDRSRFPAVVSVTALRDAQGGIIGYLLIGTDNTARKQVEAEQRKLDQRLRDQQFYTRSLIESNVDALMTTDPSGIISDVNKQMEALTGCTRDELIGAPFKNYFTDPERAEAAIKLVLSEKKVTDYELTARARDGKKTEVSYNATTFYDRDRTLQGVFAAARDVTERKRSEQALQETNVALESAKLAAEKANLAKSDFLSSMSHELRTPMNSILGMAEVLSDTELTLDQRRYLETFQRAGSNLLAIINDILDLSKVESGHANLETIPFDLHEVVERAVELIRLKADEKGIEVSSEMAEATPRYLKGDPTRLRQIILNLLGNSLKFTEKGHLTVRIAAESESEDAATLRFAISDTGVGIPADKLNKIFESFSQADDSTTRHYGGTGLGLSISKKFVELMGGRIWAESIVGQGSIFFFTAGFPVAERPPDVASPSVQRKKLQPCRILLADDSDDNRFLISAYLRDSPVSLDFAENGEVALQKLTSREYDLVLMDVHMPVLDGFAATRKFRQYERQHDRQPLPILALTADAFEDAVDRSLSSGCSAHLTKPIRKTTLLDAIAKYAKPGGRPDQVVVQIDPSISEIVPIFLANIRGNPAAILRAVEAGDLQTARGLGHNMKGTGTAYGFPVITDLGAQIEQAAKEEKLDTLRSKVSELASYLEGLEPEYP